MMVFPKAVWNSRSTAICIRPAFYRGYRRFSIHAGRRVDAAFPDGAAFRPPPSPFAVEGPDGVDDHVEHLDMREDKRLAFLGIAGEGGVEHLLVLGIMDGAAPDMPRSDPLIAGELIEKLPPQMQQ